MPGDWGVTFMPTIPASNMHIEGAAPGRLDPKADTWKTVRSVVIGAAAAALTYLAQRLAGLDFGDATPAITGCLGVLVDLLRRWITDTRQHVAEVR